MNPSAITSFDNNFDQISINSSSEAAKFAPDPTFEKTINDIKDNHLKIFTSDVTNVSAITSFYENFDPLCINNIFEAEKSNQNQHLKRILTRSNIII